MCTSKYWVLKTWLFVLVISQAHCVEMTRTSLFDVMKCSYGERGSLTATCVNATPSFFKSTFYKFDHLDETLRCVNCTLTVIEANTFDLSGNQIKVLDLQQSLITTLKPKAFMGLIFLKILNLSKNQIRSIFPGTFSGTKKITTLDVSKNEISILSESGFEELIELENLLLGENQIKVIDHRAFNGLTKLKQLDLSFNSISAVNSSLENITSLELINLTHNAIHVLNGNEFSPLINLKEIVLSYNLLEQRFAINMKPGNQLKKLSLAHNQILDLWFPNSYLDALEELDVRFNNISYIGNNLFENLYNLHTLEMAYNVIKEIKTGWFSGLPQLRTLNCSRNLITEVSITGVFSIPNLHTLDLSHNDISDLDYTALISRMPNLAYLRLEDNFLPCDLEREMENTFAEDNFKYVLYDNYLGSPKCVDKPVTKSMSKRFQDVLVENKSDSVSGVDIVIFILLSLIITALGVLYYLQYLFYKGIQVASPRRVASTVQLISSEADQREDNFDNIAP